MVVFSPSESSEPRRVHYCLTLNMETVRALETPELFFRHSVIPQKTLPLLHAFVPCSQFLPVFCKRLFFRISCRYVWLQPDVPACTNYAVQLIKCCSWCWTNDSPKHVEPFNEKMKTVHKNLCIPLVYIHIEINLVAILGIAP
jgi:hypothetical protein